MAALQGLPGSCLEQLVFAVSNPCGARGSYSQNLLFRAISVIYDAFRLKDDATSIAARFGCHSPEGAGAVRRVSRPAKIDAPEPIYTVMNSVTRKVDLVALFLASDTCNIWSWQDCARNFGKSVVVVKIKHLRNHIRWQHPSGADAPTDRLHMPDRRSRSYRYSQMSCAYKVTACSALKCIGRTSISLQQHFLAQQASTDNPPLLWPAGKRPPRWPAVASMPTPSSASFTERCLSPSHRSVFSSSTPSFVKPTAEVCFALYEMIGCHD